MKLRVLGAIGLTLLGATPLGAQSSSVRYIPMDSWMTPYIDHLARAGLLPDLDPLTRPYQRSQVSAALESAESRARSVRVSDMIRMLADELTESDDGPRWHLEPEIGVIAASDASRWVLRPTGDTARVYPQARLTASIELPHLALVTSPGIDNRLKHDPWYRGKKDRFIAGRANPAYFLGSWRYADVFFGIADRNWGPPGIEGLMLSDAPYATEHFFLRLGVPSVRLELAASQIDTVVTWDGSPTPDRWMVAHRVVIRPFSRLTLSLEESIIYAGSGLPWRYLNPLALGVLTFYDNGPQPNSIVGASVVWQAAARIRLYAQLALDDFQIDDSGQSDQEPPSYGFTLGGSGAIAGAATWTAFHTRVSNLMYRTPANQEQFTTSGVGIGRNFSDYDQTTARFDMAVTPRLLVGGEATLLRQGEGDIRLRYPPVAAFADSLIFLTGVAERTAHVGTHATWSPRSDLSLGAYVGYSALSNAGHVTRADGNRLVWRVFLKLRHHWDGDLDR